MELRGGFPRLEDPRAPRKERAAFRRYRRTRMGRKRRSGRRSGSGDSTVEREEGEDASAEGDGTATGSLSDTDAGESDGSEEADGSSSVEQDSSSPEEGSCLEAETFFEKKIWNPFVSIQCTGCHTAGGPAQATDLVFVDGSTPEGMAANFNLFAEIAQTNFGSTSLILLKPTGLHPNGHTGGVLVQPDSAEYAALEHFVDLLNGDKDPCDPIGESASCDEVQPGPRQLRRLTRFEYDRTISEIFGFESTYGSAFTPEVVVHVR